MRVLFVHQNFPGQFKHLAAELAADSRNKVIALTMQKNVPAEWRRVRLMHYQPTRSSTPNIHPWIGDFETKTIRGEAAFHAALKLREHGFTPDVIVAHPGWGESLFLKEVWPDAKLGIYCEFYYHASGADVGFDSEFSPEDSVVGCRMRMKNVNSLLHFDIADAGLSPTHWQASTFPSVFRERITVIHDGIDTDQIVPNPEIRVSLNGNTILTRDDEVITFVNRNLEPYRGYHIFMRSLPELLRRRSKAQILIIGGDDVSYGARPSEGRKWKEIFATEVRSQIPDTDWARVHFLGNIPYEHFIPVLQLSTVHVYLTYPFVLSWSLLEAMSAGCAIVASNTHPLREAIVHDETGRLVEFFDVPALTNEVTSLLEDGEARTRLGANARAFARANYDLRSVCLPRQLEWVARMVG